jgi:hypothetical protein
MRTTYDVLAVSTSQHVCFQATVCSTASGVDSSGTSTFRNRPPRISAGPAFVRLPPILGLKQERVTA